MKTTSKQADATLAKLTSAMQRNTMLATGSEPTRAASAGPVATYTATPPAAAPTPPKPKPQRNPIASHNCGIRLKFEDDARIRQVIQAGLAFQETLAVSDVIRLALQAYEPARLTASDIGRLRAQDGRSRSAQSRVA